MSAINYEDFVARLDGGGMDLPPVIAIAGGEDFMRTEAISALRKHLERQGMTWERFDDETQGAENLISLLRTPSLFGDRMAILLKSVRRGKVHESITRFKDHLVDYLDKPSKSAVLIFDGETWNGSYTVPKRVKKDYLVVTCPEFKPWEQGEIDRFIERRAQRQGLRLARNVARVLYDTCGASLGLVERELEKLALIVEGSTPLSESDLREHLNFRGAEQAFQLAEAVLTGRKEEVMDLATKVLKANDPGPALQFLGLLESQWRKLAKLVAIVHGGAKGQSAAKQAGMNPHAPSTRSFLKLAEALDEKSVLSQYRLLLTMDLSLKGAAADANSALMAGLAQMSTMQAAIAGKAR